MDYLPKIIIITFIPLVFMVLLWKIIGYDTDSYTYGPHLKKAGHPGLDPNVGAPLQHIDKNRIKNEVDEKNKYNDFIKMLQKNMKVDPDLTIKYLNEKAVFVNKLYTPSSLRDPILNKQRMEFDLRKKQHDDLIHRIKNNGKYTNGEILTFFD